ncbi:jg25696, partial [Pararge aegeria aegeria]
AQRLTSSVSPSTEEKPLRVSDMAGIVSKAKEELAKSKSKEIIKSPAIEKSPKIHEIKVSENDLHWEELRKGCLDREFHLCDLDFSDLRYDSDDDTVFPAINASNGPPPPPPGMLPPLGIPPPLPACFSSLPKNLPSSSISSELSIDSANSTLKKNKKTVKLFWKEIQENPLPTPVKAKVGGSIWDDLPEVSLDTASLEHLFESRTNDLIIKVNFYHIDDEDIFNELKQMGFEVDFFSWVLKNFTNLKFFSCMYRALFCQLMSTTGKTNGTKEKPYFGHKTVERNQHSDEEATNTADYKSSYNEDGRDCDRP